MRRQSHRFSYALPKRLFDLITAVSLFLFAAPLWLVAWSLKGFEGIKLHRRVWIGQDGKPFVGSEASDRILNFLLMLVNVTRSRLSIVGPRLMMAGSGESVFEQRWAVKPGLVCLHWLRTRSNIGYISESASDEEYVQKGGFSLDLSIAFRSLLVLVYGSAQSGSHDLTTILGVQIDNLSLSGALDRIEAAMDQSRVSLQVAFVNADCINKAVGNSSYRNVLNSAHLVLPDGIGLKIAGNLLGRPIRENVNGTDMFPFLLQRLEKQHRRIFLLGAKPEVVKRVADWVQSNYPGVVLCGAEDGYFNDEDEIVRKISESRADALLVALGAPRQELWIAKNRARLGVRVCIGVGGLFDFYSGRIPRAPVWLREVGLEWIYRLYQEPGRMWRRYLIGNLTFLARVLVERARLRGRKYQGATV